MICAAATLIVEGDREMRDDRIFQERKENDPYGVSLLAVESILSLDVQDFVLLGVDPPPRNGYGMVKYCDTWSIDLEEATGQHDTVSSIYRRRMSSISSAVVLFASQSLRSQVCSTLDQRAL